MYVLHHTLLVCRVHTTNSMGYFDDHSYNNISYYYVILNGCYRHYFISTSIFDFPLRIYVRVIMIKAYHIPVHVHVHVVKVIRPSN